MCLVTRRFQVRYMKPLLDQDFIAYMAYAIQKEREAVRRRGMNPDREPSRWLEVLGVIQKGVLAELQKDVSDDVEVSVVLGHRLPPYHPYHPPPPPPSPQSL